MRKRKWFWILLSVLITGITALVAVRYRGEFKTQTISTEQFRDFTIGNMENETVNETMTDPDDIWQNSAEILIVRVVERRIEFQDLLTTVTVEKVIATEYGLKEGDQIYIYEPCMVNGPTVVSSGQMSRKGSVYLLGSALPMREKESYLACLQPFYSENNKKYLHLTAEEKKTFLFTSVQLGPVQEMETENDVLRIAEGTNLEGKQLVLSDVSEYVRVVKPYQEIIVKTAAELLKKAKENE